MFCCVGREDVEGGGGELEGVGCIGREEGGGELEGVGCVGREDVEGGGGEFEGVGKSGGFFWVFCCTLWGSVRRGRPVSFWLWWWLLWP